MKTSHLLIAIILLSSLSGFAQSRQFISLNNGWTTIADDSNPFKYNGFEKADFPTANWQTVDVPHNWDRYEGFRRMKHGNRHGYAWYRRSFDVAYDANKRYFLFFEGVGSYATVFVNGQKVGEHAGGRTTFTLDITHAINENGLNNLLAVRADHPAEIRDLPWVCGGCSDEWGFSEGSQPLGIFRPVSLEVTNNVRIEPFGVHIWNDTTVTEKEATLNLSVELKNYGTKKRNILVVNAIANANGKTLHTTSSKLKLETGNSTTTKQVIVLNDVNLWSPQSPYLYNVTTQVWDGKTLLDNIETPYGIRWIQWPIGRKNHSGQFFINGKPLFINGTAEYEHMMGISHAFTDDQIHARAMQIKALGYNAFRDAHQPHNLRFHPYWDQLGLLWWPQMAAHIWFDTPTFRENFKTLLRQMVKERRNSPSIILWGLENESTLPTDFAKECVAIIRELDPTAHNQRLVTTCNGGTGTDWNVVQNWSGTYGGNPFNYAKEQKQQLLNGEYGAWRSIDLHTEGGYTASGPWSEDKMTLLMELKIREAEAAKDSSCGQFHWLLNSHENPGRTQNGEGLRDIDRVGPVNYKGLLTPWGEPTDAFYMYRANYAPKTTKPMVYIVSHTWPNRYKNGGLKNGIIVYSNCDEVELFNDVDGLSLGKRTNQGVGTHFQWDSININYNTLKAIGFVDGKAVASDVVVLQNLPDSPNFGKLQTPTSTHNNKKALYRINCGGPEYTDTNGNVWLADVQRKDDQTWGSLSWTDDFERLSAFYGSQRRTFDPIGGSSDWPLHQTFRFGTDRLRYQFPVKPGTYKVQLHFIEPWYGTGGGMDCNRWRLFDVGVNGQTIVNDLDIWKEVGHDKLLVKEFTVDVTSNLLELSFPKTKSGQAIISAIAIFTDDESQVAAQPSQGLLQIGENNGMKVQTWLDWGNRPNINQAAAFVQLPPQLFAAEWLQYTNTLDYLPQTTVKFNNDADVYVAIPTEQPMPAWLNGFVEMSDKIETSDIINGQYKVYTRQFDKNGSFILPKAPFNGNQLPWLMAAQPVYNMPQAADQRPIATYNAVDAQLTGNGKKDIYRNRSFVQLGPNDYQKVTWTIATGVADVYNFHIRFFHPQPTNIKGHLVMETMDGRIMMDQTVEFTPLKADGTWRGLRTQTPSTVNAGNYKLSLTLIDNGTLLGVGALEVQ